MNTNDGVTFIYKINQNYKKEFIKQCVENLFVIYDHNAKEIRLSTLQHVTETATEQNNENIEEEKKENEDIKDKEHAFDKEKPKYNLKSCDD